MVFEFRFWDDVPGVEGTRLVVVMVKILEKKESGS